MTEWPKKPLGNGLLTPPGVARLLGIRPDIMRLAIELGEVRTVTFAGYCYIPKSEAERLQRLLTGEVSE